MQYYYHKNFFLLGVLICFFWLVPLFGDEIWVYDDSLEPDIRFWKSVFSQYHNNQYIIHDTENLNIIYKVVTFDSSLSDYQKEKHVEKIKDEIKEILLQLAKNPGRQEDRSHLEIYILELFNNSANPGTYKQASRQLRGQQGMRDSFEKGLARSLPYLPFMKEIFKQKGLPEELAYLPHIESSFNPRARSKVGAAGMWQFMRSTGRLYMKVNRIIDERYDPFISTQGAARLLSYNYKKLGDWGLAITAYNFGLAGIRRAVRTHGPDYMKVRESFNHRKFKFASRNFFPEFLAVLEIMQSYRRYFPEVEGIDMAPTVRYQLRRAVKFPQLAKLLEMRVSEFKKLNLAYSSRAIKGRYTIPAGYWINVPIESDLATLEMNIENLSEMETKQKNVQKPVENYAISRLPTSKTAEELSDSVNPEPVFAYRKPGVASEESALEDDMLVWYRTFAYASADGSDLTQQLRKDLIAKFAIHDDHSTVFSNETLGHYADWLRVSLRKLQQINGLGRRKTIYQGQRMRLDFSRVTPEDFLQKRLNYHLDILNGFLEQKELVNFVEYRINQGESVWELARSRYQVPLELIQYFNIDSDMNRIYPGDILRIPIFQSNKSAEETL
jgi:membrane-bound lytic murein transglycosylase D